MKILCLTKYTARGPSSRYRLLQFQPWLEERGIELDVHPLHDDGYLTRRFAGRRQNPLYLARRALGRLAVLARARRYDLVFIQKEIFPWAPAVAEWALYRCDLPLVLDFDDAIFLPYRGRPLLERKFGDVVRRCSLVLAGNRYLADETRRFSDRVVEFPTVVDEQRFTPGTRPGGSDDIPVVGWMGSPVTVGYLRALAPALASAGRRAPFLLRVVGAGAIDVSGVDVEARPWSEEGEVEELRAMDVGLMPLADDDWARGKCSLKLLQYMSTGMATVSSPGGSVPEIIRDGDNGYTATGDDAWAARVGALVEDAALRRAVGQRARAWIESHYCLSAYGPRLADLLIAAAKGRGAS